MHPAATLSLSDRAALETARVICSTFLALGILAALHTSLQNTTNLVVFTASPSTALTWLAIGLIGAPMAYHVRRARLFLTLSGCVLLVWALAALVLDGAGADMFLRDRNLILMNLIGALACLAAATVSALRRPTTSDRVPVSTR